MIFNFCSIVLNIALCYFYVKVVDLGVHGIAIAMASSDFSLWLTLAIYSCSSKRLR